MEVIGIILLVGIGGLFLYATIADKKKKANKHESKGKKKIKEEMTVQDLFNYEYISDKGIVKLPTGTYTATLELTDINQHLNNISENAAIWKKFRTMMNSISIRETLLVQSQYLDVMDFVQDYKQKSTEITNLTPEFIEAREDVLGNYKEFAEEKTREYRSYIIFRFNPHKDGMQKGMETGNALIDNLLSSAKSKANQMEAEEEKELAESVLEEVVDLAYQMLKNIGSSAARLNRTGVLAMTYATLNRDLSVVQRIHDASDAHSFTEMKQSLTPFQYEALFQAEAEERVHELEQQGMAIPFENPVEEEEPVAVTKEDEMEEVSLTR